MEARFASHMPRYCHRSHRSVVRKYEQSTSRAGMGIKSIAIDGQSIETELVLELDVIGNVIEEVVDLAGTVPYPSTGDDHSNDCCYADPFLQCSCEQRHLVPNEDVSNHGLLRKSESL
ncbi:hypothetical protein TNCV_234001 [Trichonephila clavipes]|nr:hypothetical protein TNCV_234001 [Trichonephila clavipes]